MAGMDGGFEFQIMREVAPGECRPAWYLPHLHPKAFSFCVSKVNCRKRILKSNFIYLLGCVSPVPSGLCSR